MLVTHVPCMLVMHLLRRRQLARELQTWFTSQGVLTKREKNRSDITNAGLCLAPASQLLCNLEAQLHNIAYAESNTGAMHMHTVTQGPARQGSHVNRHTYGR